MENVPICFEVWTVDKAGHMSTMLYVGPYDECFAYCQQAVRKGQDPERMRVYAYGVYRKPYRVVRICDT